MCLDVLRQVVGPHEPLVALRALEALLPRVRPLVPLQLVRPGEPLPAEDPAADERPLAAVPSEVGAQVRRLAVDLVAAGDVADVLLLAGLAVRIPEMEFNATLVQFTDGRWPYFERLLSPSLQFGQVHATLRSLVFVPDAFCPERLTELAPLLPSA